MAELKLQEPIGQLERLVTKISQLYGGEKAKIIETSINENREVYGSFNMGLKDGLEYGLLVLEDKSQESDNRMQTIKEFLAKYSFNQRYGLAFQVKKGIALTGDFKIRQGDTFIQKAYQLGYLSGLEKAYDLRTRTF